MPDKDRPTEAVQDMLILRRPEDIRLVFNDKHNAILKMLMADELSISDISRMLNINPGSTHYHIKELEKHGLVKQVREEIKGGVVKKYYRSTARRIIFDTSDFNSIDQEYAKSDPIDRLITSIEYLGYHIPPDSLGDARELLLRYDMRVKDILAGLEIIGQEVPGDDIPIHRSSFYLILSIKSRDDPELCKIYRDLTRLFLKNE
jgi:DNA-binding transcriptional ArsR family regulator